MKALDLFCGEGGAAEGYHRAGFEVFGIDNSNTRLNRYPYPCDNADAIEYLIAHGREYDLIHASPPCTGYSVATGYLRDRGKHYDRLIAATRAALIETGKPYIIENVYGAKTEMIRPVLLCGRMFGLQTRDSDGTFLVLDRHRLFESNLKLLAKPHPKHHKQLWVGGVYGGGSINRTRAKHLRGGGYTPRVGVRRDLMDTPWMTQKGCALAIPPAYTEHLGKQAMRQIKERA